MIKYVLGAQVILTALCASFLAHKFRPVRVPLNFQYLHDQGLLSSSSDEETNEFELSVVNAQLTKSASVVDA